MTLLLGRQVITTPLLALSALAFSVAAVAGVPDASAPQIHGFAPSRTAAELALEEKFQKVPDPVHAEVDLRQLTSEPHVAGTEASRMEDIRLATIAAAKALTEAIPGPVTR